MLIKPGFRFRVKLPVITFPMQQGLSIAIQTSCWVISHHALLVII